MQFSENFRKHSRFLSFHIELRTELTSRYNFKNPLLGFVCESSVSNKQFYGSIDEVRLQKIFNFF